MDRSHVNWWFTFWFKKSFSKVKCFDWINQLLAISRNPLNKDAILETLNLPVVTEFNLIGQGNPRTIESGIHTQSIIDRTSEIIQSDIMTHLVADHSQMSLKSKSFPFHKNEASTLMFAPFVEAFLTRNGHIRTTGINGTSRPNHSRILTPGMNEDILSGNNVTTTVRSDFRVMENLETTVEAFTSNERNTESSGIIESAPESVFVKQSEQFDSSGRVNFANSIPVESPDLVSFRDPPDEAHNVTDRRSGVVATIIADKHRIWRFSPSNIGTGRLMPTSKIKMRSYRFENILTN